jgi:TonB family protein
MSLESKFLILIQDEPGKRHWAATRIFLPWKNPSSSTEKLHELLLCSDKCVIASDARGATRMFLKCFFVMTAVLSGSAFLQGETRVSTALALKAATNKPKPEYSAIARQMRVTGKVEIDLVVGADGAVEDVRIISGNPLLSAAAVAAAKKWKFGDLGQNGDKAVVSLSFDFKP